VSAPVGRDVWHRAERRLFGYWMDLTCNIAVVPYARVIADRRGHRNTLSWVAEGYLAKHGLEIAA
jgi:hypothetical protein